MGHYEAIVCGTNLCGRGITIIKQPPPLLNSTHVTLCGVVGHKNGHIEHNQHARDVLEPKDTLPTL